MIVSLDEIKDHLFLSLI
jgi:hypothetical protein